MAEVNFLEVTVSKAGAGVVDAVFYANKYKYMLDHGITDEANLTANELAFIMDSAKLATASALTILVRIKGTVSTFHLP